MRSGKDKINSRFNTSIPEFIARARTILVLLERRAASSTTPSYVPFRKYFDLKIDELYQAYHVCFDPALPWDIKKSGVMQRLRRELKTDLADVANKVDEMLRYPDHLSAWPGFDTSRNPGRWSERIRSRTRPGRQLPSADTQ